MGTVRQGAVTNTRWANGVGIVRQPGGRLVAAMTFFTPDIRSGRNVGTTTTVGLIRVTASGQLDRTFGHNGEVITNVSSGNERALSLVRQADGRLVLAGTSRGRMLVVRYTASGRLDRSFGSGGTVVVSPGPGTDKANGLAARSGGRILLAGQSGKLGALVQMRSDGRLDPGFGRRGQLLVNVGPAVERLTAVRVDGQGRLVVAGTEGSSAVVTRFSARGALDRSFGVRGVARVGDAGGRALALDSQGRAVLAAVNYRGRSPDGAGRPQRNGLVVARFTPQGKPDSGYGSAGVTRMVSFSPGGGMVGEPTAIVLDSSGRSLITGNEGGCASLARFTSTGALDTTFGPGDPTRLELPQIFPLGIVCPSATQVLEPALDEGGAAVFAGLLVQPDRRIVTVGTLGGDETGGGPYGIVARYFD